MNTELSIYEYRNKKKFILRIFKIDSKKTNRNEDIIAKVIIN